MSATAWVALALAGVVLLALLWKLSRRGKTKPWIELASCPKCGWRGQTSRYAGRCPRCNSPIGEQRATRGGAAHR